jgi:H+/Cl- antiporter ClcA
MQQAGKFLIAAGIILVIAGLIVYFAGNKLNWLGHLPGDIRIEKENVRFYFPITTMIILSIVLSAIVYLIRKFF